MTFLVWKGQVDPGVFDSILQDKVLLGYQVIQSDISHIRKCISVKFELHNILHIQCSQVSL